MDILTVEARAKLAQYADEILTCRPLPEGKTPVEHLDDIVRGFLKSLIAEGDHLIQMKAIERIKPDLGEGE